MARCMILSDTILCDNVCQWLATGWGFSPVSSTDKTDCHNITEILLNHTVHPYYIVHRYILYILCKCTVFSQSLIIKMLLVWCRDAGRLNFNVWYQYRQRTISDGTYDISIAMWLYRTVRMISVSPGDYIGWYTWYQYPQDNNNNTLFQKHYSLWAFYIQIIHLYYTCTIRYSPLAILISYVPSDIVPRWYWYHTYHLILSPDDTDTIRTIRYSPYIGWYVWYLYCQGSLSDGTYDINITRGVYRMVRMI
jgi:hypothetical protein